MIKTQLAVTTRTNLFQLRNAQKFKNKPCAQVSYSVEKGYVDDSKSILAEIKEKKLTSLLTATTMKMNSKYCKPLP